MTEAVFFTPPLPFFLPYSSSVCRSLAPCTHSPRPCACLHRTSTVVCSTKRNVSFLCPAFLTPLYFVQVALVIRFCGRWSPFDGGSAGSRPLPLPSPGALPRASGLMGMLWSTPAGVWDPPEPGLLWEQLPGRPEEPVPETWHWEQDDDLPVHGCPRGRGGFPGAHQQHAHLRYWDAGLTWGLLVSATQLSVEAVW